MEKPSIQIDGLQFSSLEEFFEHFSSRILGDSFWGRNLNAFNDVLRGGFGSPEGGFVLVWLNHDVSKQRLGFPETVRQLERILERCHPTNRDHIREVIAEAKQGRGQTAYDWLVTIILTHCPGGEEEEDGLELVLS